MNSRRLLLFAICLLLPSSFAAAEETVAAAIHVHSDISSGGVPINAIADLAEKQKVDVVIMTDLFAEKYEYGIGPLKKTVERGSILKTGPGEYLSRIQKANELHPNVLMMDGTAVTPFYYWTGSLWSQPLILNDRAKDLLVLGLGEAMKYQFLPAVQNGRLKFNTYQSDLFQKPYQKFIDDTVNLGGMVFWSHPQASEKIVLENFLFGFDLILQTPPYAESLIETTNYTGFGVYSSELAQVHTASEATASPGGVWDRVLRQHCRGLRAPVWAIGEVDYNGKADGIRDLDGILNMIQVPEKSRENILKSLSQGKLYLIIPSSRERRLVLEDYAVFDRTSERKALSGGNLEADGVPIVRLSMKYSDASAGNIQVHLLRNGNIIERWNKTLPFAADYEDWENTEPGKSYYRVVAFSEETPDRLMTNPIFVEHS